MFKTTERATDRKRLRVKGDSEKKKIEIQSELNEKKIELEKKMKEKKKRPFFFIYLYSQ